MKGIQMTEYDLDVKVVRDEDGRIASGLVVGDILNQNQAMILSLGKGELKSNPSVGVGMMDYLLDHDMAGLQREIREQLEMDGQTVESVAAGSLGIAINSKY